MVEHVLVVGPPPLLTGDITFEVTECGFEILFPDRISHEHKDLFNELGPEAGLIVQFRCRDQRECHRVCSIQLGASP
jgi:hypothetical protein